MAKKNERRTGFFQGMNISARLNEVAFLSMVQKHIDSGEYKKEYETVREFVKEELGFSYDTFQRRMEAMRSIGPEITGIFVAVGIHIRDLKMIEHMMTEEQKANLKKGVIEVGDRKIPIDADHAEDIRIAVANLKETAELALKAEKQAKKEAASIKKEYDAGNAPMKKELDELRALVVIPDTPEKIIEGFKRIDEAFSAVDLAIRTFAWKDAKKLIAEDVALQAKVQGLQEQMRARVEALIKDWDIEINGE